MQDNNEQPVSREHMNAMQLAALLKKILLTPDGEKVIALLKEIYLMRDIARPTIPIETVRYLEGQNSLIRQIIQLLEENIV
jgi:hypothetical protein